MKTIIMQQTVSLMCKTQEDFDKLSEEGFVIKQTEISNYLIKLDE